SGNPRRRARRAGVATSMSPRNRARTTTMRLILVSELSTVTELHRFANSRLSLERGLRQEAERGAHNLPRLDQLQTVVVALGADAPVAVLARYVVKQDPARYPPRRVLRVRQRVKVDDGRAN